MGVVTRTFRHTKRWQEIITVLVKYGMGNFVRSSGIADTFPFLKKLIPKRYSRPISDFSRFEDIRMAIEELGPTFVKLGQILSNRPDILPVGLIKELEKLQDDVPPFDSSEVSGIFKKEFGKDIGDLFADFDLTPMASASIGQVYKALLFDGVEVAVKVQRPGIEETISIDLEILNTFARIIQNNIEQAKNFNPVGVVKEFERSIKKELDYQNERRNLERFRKFNANEPHLVVPASYKNLTTKRVLTMELVGGVKISRIADENLPGYDREYIANLGAELIIKQIFVYGFFHADPHPGNILVLDNNNVCFLDFGMMGTVVPAQRELLGSLLVALGHRDSELITKLMLELTNYPDHPQKADIEYEIGNLIDSYVDLPLDELNIADVLESMISLIHRYQLIIPSNLSMLIKTIVMIEGVGRQLCPKFRINTVIERIVPLIMKDKLKPKHLLHNLYLVLADYRKLLTEFPDNMRSIISKVQQGKLKIEFEVRGLEPLQSTLDAVSYRILFGAVLAALIIGSSILLHIEKPHWKMIPTIGMFGFITGVFFAVGILIITVTRTFRK